MAFELKIKTDISMLPEVVETNIDEVTPIIDAAIAKTQGLEVTNNRDEIIAADEDAAKLTKMSKAVARFRIDNVAKWKAPMEVFEKKCKDAEKRLDEAAEAIRAKTSEVKDIWRAKKASDCTDALAKLVEEAFPGDKEIAACPHLATFLAYWVNPKTKGTWVNSTVKMPAVEEAIKAELERMKQTLAASEANYANEPEEVKAKARLALLVRFDMNDVIAAVNAWKKEQADIAARAEAERQRKADADAKMEAAKKELAERRQAEAVAPAAPVTTPEPPKPSPVDIANETVETYRLAITGTRAALKEMRRYAESIGITFKNLDK